MDKNSSNIVNAADIKTEKDLKEAVDRVVAPIVNGSFPRLKEHCAYGKKVPPITQEEVEASCQSVYEDLDLSL